MPTRFMLTLMLACGLATAASAADSSGMVLAADGDTITLRLDDGTQVTHTLAPNVTIRAEDGATLTASDLAQREVEVQLDASQRATEIQVTSTEGAAAAQRDLAAGDTTTLAQRELPDTAGVVPLVALIGGAALAAALGVRALRRR